MNSSITPLPSSSITINSSQQNNNNNNTALAHHQSAHHQQQKLNAEALLAAVKMLRLGTKQASTCKDALDRLQKMLLLPMKNSNNTKDNNNNNNNKETTRNQGKHQGTTSSHNNKTNAFFAIPPLSSTSTVSNMNNNNNSLNPNNNNNNSSNNNNLSNFDVFTKKFTAAEIRLNRRQFVLNSVGGPGVLMNALQVAGNDFGVAESCLSLMVALLVPPAPSSNGTNQQQQQQQTANLNSNAFNPLLPRTVKGRARGALRRLVKKFIKKSGTRLLFALLVKHFDASLSPSYVRGIVFPVCKLIHCFLLGDTKLAATARLSGGLQVLTRIVLAFINHSPSLSVPMESLELIIPGILTTIASLCNVKLSLNALSRNGLGVASLLNLIRNVLMNTHHNNNHHHSNETTSTSSLITIQAIVRWSFRLLFNYLVVDSSANTKIALENNIVDVCVSVLERFSTNSSFMQLHCVILDVLTLLLYGTPYPVLSECGNNTNHSSSESNNRLRSSIISPQRERDIIRLVARAACSPHFVPVSKNSPFVEDVSNPRDIIDLYNQLTKFLGMTELPIGMDADLVWQSDSPTTACPPALLKKGGGDSSSDDDENENDEDNNGEGELAKLSLEERDLVEEFEENMKRRISMLCPEMNVAQVNNNNNNSTIPRETLLPFDSILDPASGIVRKVHYSGNSFAETTSTPFSIKNPPAWPVTANAASTENILPVEPVPDDPLPDDVFRQLARNQFLRLVDPKASPAQIVFDNFKSRSQTLPRIYSHPPHQEPKLVSSSSATAVYTTPCLSFDCDFECGNLKRVIRIGDCDYDIITSGDTNTERQGQWYYFAIRGMIAGVQYTFRFINAERAGSTFGSGNRPLMFSDKLFSECKTGWMRCGEEIAYFKNSYVKPSSAATLLSQQQQQQQLLQEERKAAAAKKKGAVHSKKKGKTTLSTEGSANTFENDHDDNNNNDDDENPSNPATAASTKKKSSSTKTSILQQQLKKEATIQSLVKPPTTMNTLHVSIRFPYSNDRVFLCPGLPFSYTDLIRYLNYLPLSPDCIESTYFTKQQQQQNMMMSSSFSNNNNSSIINPGCLMIQTFCDTDSGLPVPILTITQLYKEDPTSAINLGGTNASTAATASMIMRTPVSAAEMASRPVCVVSARVHPGETVSSFAVKGLIDFLLDPMNPVSKALRQSTVWKIVPMLNPDGVVHGHYRCDLHGYDLNRMFHPQPLAIRTPTVAHLNQLFTHLRVNQNRKVVFYGDFHGHSKKTGCFTYGCGSAKRAVHGAIVESIFPAVLHSLLPGFDPEGCTYRVAQGKIATGRVVAYRQHGIRMAYTLEVSLMGGWRFAPTSTCEDNEIIERDAVRNPSAKSLAERRHFKNLMKNKSCKIEENQDHVVNHEDDEEEDNADDGPELVLHTPQSLCAIGAMFVKAFYCIAENFLSVKAENLFRIKKPNILDVRGNVVGTTFEVEALPRRGVVAETAANLLIAHAKLEKLKRIQVMEQKIFAKSTIAKRNNTNNNNNKGTKNDSSSSNNKNASSSSSLSVPSSPTTTATNTSTSSNNNNVLAQMEKQLSESGLQIPPHFAQEVLAACLNIYSLSSSYNKSNSTFNSSSMMNFDLDDGTGNNNNNQAKKKKVTTKNPSSSTMKTTSIISSLGSAATAGGSALSSYLQDLIQVTVAWGGKPKEVGVIMGGNNANIISTNIHTPLWAASVSPGGLIVDSSARTVAMKESYSIRRTPTALGGERCENKNSSNGNQKNQVNGSSKSGDNSKKGDEKKNKKKGESNNRNNKLGRRNIADDEENDDYNEDEFAGEDEDEDENEDDDEDEDEDEDLEMNDDEDDDEDDDDDIFDDDDDDEDENEDEGGLNEDEDGNDLEGAEDEGGDENVNNNESNNQEHNKEFERTTSSTTKNETSASSGNVSENSSRRNSSSLSTTKQVTTTTTHKTNHSFSVSAPTTPTTGNDTSNNTTPKYPASSSANFTTTNTSRTTSIANNNNNNSNAKKMSNSAIQVKPVMKLPQHPSSATNPVILRGNNNNNNNATNVTMSVENNNVPSLVLIHQPPPPKLTACGFGLHKHLSSSRPPSNSSTMAPSPPASSTTTTTTNSSSHQQQQQQTPKTTNPNIKYAGSLARNRDK